MGAGDDNSTDIETLVKAFAKDMDAACAELRKARMWEAMATGMAVDAVKGALAGGANLQAKGNKNNPADPPVITFTLSTNKISGSRTPAEQAGEVAKGRSWVCWSAHMADRARHVVMKVNGAYTDDAKKAMGADFEAFKKKWAEAMARNGLKNAHGEDGWYVGDEFHLELPDSKVGKTDLRASACLAEYARLTRKEGKPKNEKFEKAYAKLLAKHVVPYEKK